MRDAVMATARADTSGVGRTGGAARAGAVAGVGPVGCPAIDQAPTMHKKYATIQNVAPRAIEAQPSPPSQHPAINSALRPWPRGSSHSGSVVRSTENTSTATAVPTSEPPAIRQ